MTEQTVKCPICGNPYVFYAYYAGDQSACPKCRQEAREGTKIKDDVGWRKPKSKPI